MKVGRHGVLALMWAAFPLLAGAEGSAPFSVGAARVESRVQSMKAMRDSGVVRQRFDYSCGAAALATLLTYGLNDGADESSILAEIVASLTEEGIAELHKRGLSLFDLAALAQGRGYLAQGFRIPAAQLARVSRPVIVFVQPRGYGHFVVLKGVRDERVYLADPSLGNVRMPLYQFLAMWADESGRGIVLAVEPPDRRWPQHFALELN
jgi:predicted double-glycine peptidase